MKTKTNLLMALMVFSFNTQSALQSDLPVEEQLLKDLAKVQTVKNHTDLLLKNNGNFVTVGAGATCDFNLGNNKIQDAIDSGTIEIRIAMNAIYTENLLIDDIDVTLRGGFADCTAAENNTQTLQRVEISGSSNTLPVIQISGDSQRNFIRLENLQLVDGLAGAATTFGGGISVVSADAEIQLIKLIIVGNAAFSGGGIGISAGDVDIIATDVIISGNTGGHGGGVYCSGPASSMLFLGTSGISLNNAETLGFSLGRGGGVYVENSCLFIMYSSMTQDIIELEPGVNFNDADAEGGGIYAASGSTVQLYGQQLCAGTNCLGDDVLRMNISHNVADRDSDGNENGGGVYLTGGQTGVFLAGVFMGHNSTQGNGGAVYVDDGAEFRISRIGKACWDAQRCNLVLFNQSGKSNGIGGAIYNNNSRVNVSDVFFEENRADFGTAIYSTGQSATNRIEGCVFDDNGDDGNDDFSDNFVVRVFGGASMEIIHSTFADNNAQTVLGFDSAFGSSMSIDSSIVHDPTSGNVSNVLPGSISANCVLVHESSSLSGNLVVVDDPEFVDRQNGDFHLNPLTSPALDYCDDSNTQVIFYDMDYEERGWDDPTAVNLAGPFDIGADETYTNDIIFEDGFD